LSFLSVLTSTTNVQKNELNVKNLPEFSFNSNGSGLMKQPLSIPWCHERSACSASVLNLQGEKMHENIFINYSNGDVMQRL